MITSPKVRVVLGAGVLLFATAGFAQKTKKAPPDGLEEYLKTARASATPAPLYAGSLWEANGRFSEITSDYKARTKDDTVIIRVVEDTSAVQSGTAKTSRAFNASSSISGVAGYTGSIPELAELFGPNSSRTLNGTGATSSSTTLRSNLAGRVVEVLPNGSLVVEAIRDFDINEQRQRLIVRGIVRPGDIARDNSVLSSQVGNLQLELKGKGVITDATERPNIIVRTLLKILNF